VELFSSEVKSISTEEFNQISLEPCCSMRTDGRTDMTKLIVAFRSFTNAPNRLKRMY
jgi:hypothetical protein